MTVLFLYENIKLEIEKFVIIIKEANEINHSESVVWNKGDANEANFQSSLNFFTSVNPILL